MKNKKYPPTSGWFMQEVPDRHILDLCKYLKVTVCLSDGAADGPSQKIGEAWVGVEDEPSKKLQPSCLSCRFCIKHSDAKPAYCGSGAVNRCFGRLVFRHPESTKELGFSCSFYEFNLDFEESFGKQGRTPHDRIVDGGSGHTGNMPPAPMTR